MTTAQFAGAPRLVRAKAYDPAWISAFAQELQIAADLIDHVEIDAHEEGLRATSDDCAEIEFDFAAIAQGEAHCISALASVELTGRQPKITLLRFIDPN